MVSPPTGTEAVPTVPRGALHTGGAWLLMASRSVGSVSGQAPPPLTSASGDSRETVSTFAGVCTVSGETDDTIASQIHLDLVLFHRAKASWVSCRRPEVPALVLTVTCCGAVSSMGATKFAQRGLSMTKAQKYSPSAGKTVQNGRFIACGASVSRVWAGVVSVGRILAFSGTFIRPRGAPPALRPGRSMRACPPDRRNRPFTRIGYCDMDRL